MILIGNLPVEITSSNRCVLWNPERRGNENKPTKVPYRARAPRAKAAVNDPSTWAPFKTAYDAFMAHQGFGVGIVLDGSDRLVGIDLDECRHAGTGAIEPWAQTAIQRLDSYTEASPSGTGLRVFVFGTLPSHGRKKGHVELYAAGKFLTITGHWIAGTPRTINDRTSEILALHLGVFGPAPAPASPRPAAPNTDLDDAALLTRATQAKNGALFSALWSGDLSRYNGDQSAADLALCNCLSFWCGRDGDRVDRLFRQSGLMRPKWDSPRRDSTYGTDTIVKAIVGCVDIYQPPIEIEIEDPDPVEPIEPAPAAAPWPTLGDDAYIGLFGDLIHALSPETEADPVALLGHALVLWGNLVGRSPRALVGADEHHLNTNLLIVGGTSSGRKGMAWSEIKAVMELVDPDWAATRIATGLSSGEGLIFTVRDPRDDDDGVSDKRLAVLESEFGKTLRVSRREGNVLSATVRQAWDHGVLRTLTKNSPTTATDTHVSIIGHITPRELRKELTTTDMASGFINRFLLLLARRSGYLPNGGQVDVRVRDVLVRRFQRAADVARRGGILRRNDAAAAYWTAVYPRVTRERAGLVGDICTRAPAHILRLSMLYALAAESMVITLDHLKAALALWEYAEASTLTIFGERAGDKLSDFFLTVLRAHSTGLTRTELSAKLGRNRKAEDINAALELLKDYGLADRVKEPTDGRPVERWFAVDFDTK